MQRWAYLHQFKRRGFGQGGGLVSGCYRYVGTVDGIFAVVEIDFFAHLVEIELAAFWALQQGAPKMAFLLEYGNGFEADVAEVFWLVPKQTRDGRR